MAESRTITGSRNDLVLDASRCLRMRYCDSRCRHCVDICPHGAISLDGGLAINPEQCHACLLCTAVCPVGALEQNDDFSACLAQLSKAPEAVLGCIRTADRSHGTMACLGGLSEEHLLSFCHTLAGRLTLNLSLCSDCPNSAAIATLKQRMEFLFKARPSYGSCRIETVESAQDINYRDQSVDRRGFFKSFRASLFTSAAVILSTNTKQTERRSEYAEKRIPIRRTLLNSTRDKLSPALQIQVRKHFDTRVAFENSCTGCQGCVAICPTGALQTKSPNMPPFFDQRVCTGCGLCREFCMDEAVLISTEDCE